MIPPANSNMWRFRVEDRAKPCKNARFSGTSADLISIFAEIGLPQHGGMLENPTFAEFVDTRMSTICCLSGVLLKGFQRVQGKILPRQFSLTR